MPDVTPRPKSGKRIIDRGLARRAVLTYPSCAACGNPAANAHHIVQKGAPHFGDDVIENTVGLCGSGTIGCHGAIHGNPYVVNRGHANEIKLDPLLLERRDADWVSRKIGATIRNYRPDVIEYVRGKLGKVAGDAYLGRFYPGAVDADGLRE